MKAKSEKNIPGKNGPRRSSAFEIAVEGIRDKIFMQEYACGFVLTEALLAGEYDISRGSIRSALFVLEKEGLIATRPNGRKVVLGINEKYVDDLHDIRNIIERTALSSCITLPSVDYSRLAVALTGFYTSGVRNIGELSIKRARANTGFHRTLVEIAENRPLLQCWETIESSLTALSKVNYMVLGDSLPENDLVKSHMILLEMIVSRDKRVLDKLSKHVLDAKLDSINGLKSVGWL